MFTTNVDALTAFNYFDTFDASTATPCVTEFNYSYIDASTSDFNIYNFSDVDDRTICCFLRCLFLVFTYVSVSLLECCICGFLFSDRW